MYRKKLVWAFISLCSLILLQAGTMYWLVQTAQTHEKRSHVAHDMLIRYTDISADKQRLKVWYAQLLLTGQAPEATREQLLVNINANIQALRRLSSQQVEMQQHAGDVANGLNDMDTLTVLEQNFSNFSQRVVLSLSDRKLENKEQIWHEVLGIFDMANTRDVRLFIAAAIKQHTQLYRQAEEDANAVIRSSNMVRAVMIFLTCAATLLMASYFARTLKQPLDDLLLSTQRLQAGHFDLGQPVVVRQRSSDEFGQLAQSFNAMALEIHNTRLRDKAKNELLEAAVQERTVQLTRANLELQQADIQRRQLFAGLSHELRTPATAILGEAEIALRGQDKPAADYRLSLGNIASTTRQLAQRINELLLLAREQSQATRVDLALVPLLPILQEALGQARSLAQGHALVVNASEHEAAVADLQVKTDALKLLQTLMTLYDNAVRYTPEGGMVQTQVKASATAVEVSITDSGIGLLAAEAADVFKRNFRGTQARLMRSDGAGLGLTLAKTLADELGITLSLQNHAGGGCRATLCIPL